MGPFGLCQAGDKTRIQLLKSSWFLLIILPPALASERRGLRQDCPQQGSEVAGGC